MARGGARARAFIYKVVGHRKARIGGGLRGVGYVGCSVGGGGGLAIMSRRRRMSNSPFIDRSFWAALRFSDWAIRSGMRICVWVWFSRWVGPAMMFLRVSEVVLWGW